VHGSHHLDKVALQLCETRAPVIFLRNCVSPMPGARLEQSTIPATLIGNWEIAGIRFRDVSQSVNITVIGHLKLPERKVTFVLVRTFGKMLYVTVHTLRPGRIEIDPFRNNFRYYCIKIIPPITHI